MKTVLLISNTGGDDTGGRAEKIVTRSRLLHEKGWTVELGQVPQPYLRTFFPSIYRCWRIANERDVDVITSMSNPMHLQLVGMFVSLLTNVPWVAEFRDPMVENPDREDGSITKILAKIIESLTVRLADRVAWIDGIQMKNDYFIDTYPRVPESRFQKLPFLGFEKDRFERVEPVEYDEFTITYAGSFYEGWIEPYSFLDGLERYVEEHGRDVRVQFYGDWSDEYQRAVEDRGLQDIVRTHDFVSHEQIVPILKGSDVCLFIASADPENALSVPSKIWDYIAARSPILVIGDTSFRIQELVGENDLGTVIHPEDTQGISDAIRELRRGDVEYSPSKEVFERFSRGHFMDEYADMLNAVADEPVTDSETGV